MIAVLASRWLPWLPLYGTLGIIVIAHLINRVPYGTRVMNSALGQVHRDLEEIAQVCGTKTPTIMRRVVLPLVKPSVVYLAVWTAMLSFQEVTMALFLSGPHNTVLSVSIWSLMGSRQPGDGCRRSRCDGVYHGSVDVRCSEDCGACSNGAHQPRCRRAAFV